MPRSSGLVLARVFATTLMVAVCVLGIVGVAVAVSEEIAAGTCVSAAAGDPIPDAYIEAFWQDEATGDWYLADYTVAGLDGTYSLRDQWGYGAGEYDFRVSATGFVAQSITATWDGADPLALDFTLVSIPIIAEGSVTDTATGEPIEGAYVEAYWFDAGMEGWVFADGAYTGPDGAYVLNDESAYGAGDFEIHTEAAGYTSQTATGTWDGETPLSVGFMLETPVVIQMANISRHGATGPGRGVPSPTSSASMTACGSRAGTTISSSRIPQIPTLPSTTTMLSIPQMPARFRSPRDPQSRA
jgi:protocatechuate 3,4-dioxygenase beta subunit